jgi:hypothetical protein
MPLDRVPLAVLAVVALCLPTALLAQWPTEVAAGARVQARLPEAQYQMDGVRGQLIRGRVTSLSADTLYLAVADSVGSLAIPRTMVQRLHLSRGVPSRGVNALRRGVLMGLVGAFTALTAYSLIDEQGDPSIGEATAIYGGVSFGVGAILGAIFPHERWKRVQMED